MTTPASRTIQPAQSHALQPSRQRRARSPVHTKTSAATTNVAGITTSSPRTKGATSAATAAAAIQARPRVASAFTSRKKQSAEYGYANGSSRIREEYESAGIVAAPAAAKSAQRCETSCRARKYVGKITEVITATCIAFSRPYARVVSCTSHAGAVSHATRECDVTGTPRRAAWPDSAIARASCVLSSSSPKSQGLRFPHASQPKMRQSQAKIVTSGSAAYKRDAIAAARGRAKRAASSVTSRRRAARRADRDRSRV